LQDFYVTVTRKLTPRQSRDKVRRKVFDFLLWKPAAAKFSDRATLVTEYLHGGLDPDGLRIADPFAPTFDPASL
jgi:hypothetical protein